MQSCLRLNHGAAVPGGSVGLVRKWDGLLDASKRLQERRDIKKSND